MGGMLTAAGASTVNEKAMLKARREGRSQYATTSGQLQFVPQQSASSEQPSYGGGGGGGSVAPRRAAAAAPRQSVAALAPDYSREDSLRQQQWAREDKLAAEKRARQEELFNRFGSMFDQRNVPSTVSRTSGPSAVQEAAARDAAFARSKEQAGQTARASMTALQDAVGERGLMGSSVEAAQTGAIVGGAAGDIGEFLRDRAITESAQASKNADLDFQGQVTQRGQTLGRQQQQQQALLSLIGGLY